MRPTRRDIGDGAAWTGLSIVWAFVMVFAIAGIAASLWGVSVLLSDAHGSGQVHKDQQSASNREHWSATYNAEYQQLQADQENVATLHDAATAPGATQQDHIDYQGAQLNCRTDAAKYNADAQNVLGAQWLPAGLPTIVNPTILCGS